MSETWKVQVRLSDASKLEVTVPKEGTLLEVKQTIGPLLSPPADASALRIVFKGRILVDTDTLSAFGKYLLLFCTIHGLNPFHLIYYYRYDRN
jgi:hypothetical protein